MEELIRALQGWMEYQKTQDARAREEEREFRTQWLSKLASTGSTIFHPYDGSPATFDEWANHVRVMVASRKAVVPDCCYEIIGALRGSANLMAQRIVPKLASYTSLEPFLEDLRRLFVSPAHRQQARALYERRVQLPGEPVKIYHGLLHQLYNDAYEKAEQKEASLIEHFVRGLRDERIANRLLELEVEKKFPKTYDEALEMVLHYNAQHAKLAKSKAQDSRKCELELRQYREWLRDLKEPKREKEVKSTTTFTPEPMEVDACKLHPFSPHTDADCRVQKKRKKQQLQKKAKVVSQATKAVPATSSTPTVPPRKRKSNLPRNVCAKCRQTGHWAKDCPGKAGQDQVSTLLSQEQESPNEEIWPTEDLWDTDPNEDSKN